MKISLSQIRSGLYLSSGVMAVYWYTYQQYPSGWWSVCLFLPALALELAGY